jgi:agmatinase
MNGGLEELGTLLRPAGGGLYLVSTGKAEQEALQRRLYGAASAGEVQARWRDALARVPRARVAILGIPSDVGAGFLRGANLGPQALRTGLVEAAPALYAREDVVDLGDVFVVPQLLHDDMLSASQLAASRRALYGDPDRALPVSPLSIAERALDLVFALNPRVAPVVLGGDHSCAWPVAAALARARPQGSWGIVQPDAHTDLLEERLGVKYCFATWSHHANELLGRGGRMVQVGTRASRHDRGHWEAARGVRQFWAEECRARPAAVLDEIVAHLRATGVGGVYFSNDIDGTDEAHADATGTPEPNGLEPDFVIELIRRLARDIGLIGGDVMEVAPPLTRRPDSSWKTVSLAVRYLRETIEGILR